MNQSHTVLIPPGAFIMGTDIESFYGTALANSAHAKLDEPRCMSVFWTRIGLRSIR